MASIVVLYGTETGNAEYCAGELSDALQDAGFPCEAQDMERFDPAHLASTPLVLIVTSTFGNGDPPANAEPFMMWLRRSDSVVPGTRFAVCGLGDETYPRFCQAGKDFDALLEERGGTRVVDRQDCDVDYEEPFEQFTEAVVHWLKEGGAASLEAQGEPAAAAAPEPPAAVPATTAAPSASTATAILRSRRRLNQAGSIKETVHYELAFEGEPIPFEPGDSFSVRPHNNPAEVRQILTALALDPHTPVQRDGATTTIQAVLTEAMDLQAVTPALLAVLEGKPRSNASAWLADRHLLDVLRACPAARINAQALVTLLRPQRPRLYSVANSPLETPGEVHFTVETLRYEAHGRPREGVATTWFADRLADGARVELKRVPGRHFRLPDPALPILMVGPGTGIAPFRAFLQERRAQRATGRSWLFFGHQHHATDFLYQDELEALQASGVLTALTCAWSRDQAHKVYVQDRIREQGEAVWGWLEAGAHVYVCGDKNAMAPAVMAAFVELATRYGGHSPSDAQALVDAWQESGRYSVDAY